ncbi:signal peptide peptidase SppA [Aggregicoccus sp. 17bor-14]|uniref:signal peptide peptidase SppA n=1 Tax=Myxococcaceae TaxID=31 RepID=UPI00129CFE6D|nr:MULTISPECIES: signal peptide peptidase SppA [Myxococcaceae]MBF5044885.1 signal peptide peptidase SppA [Simulacricoccus sp. 17bor-14]MRI90629.1 signal peptide peptidase SppA [Aggregicoccus sp. 17bor-14]
MRPALLLSLLPSLALAQTSELVRPNDPSRGITLPPTSPALVDEATALSLNPAALSTLGSGQLVYVHERDVARDGLGDGLFVGSTFFGSLGLGASVEWLRGREMASYRRSGLGLSLGAEPLSLGVGYHWYASGENSRVDALSSWDLGLSARPWRPLSLSFVVRNVDAPGTGPAKLPREWDLGVGVRPFGERYSLAADYRVASGQSLNQGRLGYTLQAQLFRGVGLSAGLSHGLRSGEELALQFGVTLDAAHLGLTYAGGGYGEGLDHVLAVRLSREKYASLPTGGGKVALLDLDDRLASSSGVVRSVLGWSAPDPYLRLMRFLDEATRDPQLAGVVLKIEGLRGSGWGKAEELRQAVLRLRASGKRVLAVLLSVDDAGYMVASAADEIWALPAANLRINGLSATVTHLGGTMEKLGVSWDVARVGEFKNAPEQLTRKDMSEAQRETVNAYLDTEVRHYERTVAAARKLPPGRLQQAYASGLVTARQAKELGLVDGVLVPEELDRKAAELVPGGRFDPDYAPRDERDRRWGSRRRIAIVPVIGAIAGGKSREDPLGASRIAGAETVVRALQRAQEDPGVAAIVVRVDSGGGDVLASDLMYRAVLEAKKHKPVVASMGDVAASGGYYASMGADEILASPTTLTGSIGVFFLKPALGGLGERLGVHQETVTRAPLPGLLQGWRPWTPEEQHAAQAWVDSAYDDFISNVAESRHLQKAAVDAMARGRVWSGEDAKARGLVDRFGGLLDAVAVARERAGVPAAEELDLQLLGEAGGLFSSLGGEPGVLGQALNDVLPPQPSPVPPLLQDFLQEVGGAAGTALAPGVQAALPYSVVVQ